MLIASQEPEAVAAGIEEALARGAEGHRARPQRVLDEFPMEIRREGILAVTAEALDMVPRTE